MEEKQFLEELVKRYVANALSREELDIFFRLMAEGKLDEPLARQLDQEAGTETEASSAIAAVERSLCIINPQAAR